MLPIEDLFKLLAVRFGQLDDFHTDTSKTLLVFISGGKRYLLGDRETAISLQEFTEHICSRSVLPERINHQYVLFELPFIGRKSCSSLAKAFSSYMAKGMKHEQ